MDSKEPQIGSSSREMREERLLQSVDSSQDEISKNTSAEKSLAEPEEKNGYHNIYDKFNVKEQEIVKLVSALESIRSEIKKPMPNKEAINILLDIAMI
ncbi:MAG: hypothetical protein U0944_03320, partial [Candidatus Moranbacteria bacterium]|nr:hypothetical protein [Candidatus Moranbacteria bacterium]